VTILPKDCQIPNLAGLSDRDARNAIANAGPGFVLGSVTHQPSGQPVDSVLSQSLREDSSDPVIIDVVEASGTYVPSLFAEDPDEASLTLQAAGLQLGTVGCCVATETPYLDGEVMVQSIGAGAQVPYGTTIDVTVGFFNPNQCGPFPC
jgi:beta-lactam-binding protein with PASTA domain